MYFQCVDNALQRVDNGSQRIFNVNQSIEQTLTMFDKYCRMDEKCFKTRWQLFPTFDPNAAQNVENKGQPFRSVATKLHTLSTQPIALCLHATNSTEHHNSVSERI